MSQEFELKLHLPERQVAAFRREMLLQRFARGPITTRNLRSIYFDTADRDLSKAGIALRVRRVNRRWLQTIKLPVPTASAQVHEEIEAPVRGAVPELGARERDILARTCDTAIDPAALAPIFETSIRRTIWPLRFEGTDIELVYDRGLVEADGREERISEIELELESGAPQRLFDVALKLIEAHPLTIEPRTKAARGFSLADGWQPEPVKSAPLVLDADMTVGAGLMAMIENCLQLYHRNSVVLRHGDDPEGIHQMRVALRRLRALIGACRDTLPADMFAYLTEALRWLQQQLGPARDWDVFIAETLAPMQRRLPDDGDLPTLQIAAAARREDAYRHAKETIDDRRHCEIMLRIGGWLAGDDWLEHDGDAPLGDFARDRLQGRYRRLRRFGKADNLALVELHELRIAAKKMRYLAEFFRPIYPRKASRAFLLALAELQDDLGSINDAVVTEHLMADVEPLLVAHIGKVRSAQVRSLIAGWQAQRVEHDLVRFRKVWNRFRKCPVFWPKPPKSQSVEDDLELRGLVADERP
ncbi:MAG: CHAD domain-containing protein [Rhodospirillaceae bacterium]|nr:CHAD domain-containing protein [Rhodospirillaceae bacterium]